MQRIPRRSKKTEGELINCCRFHFFCYRLVGLVVKASAWRAEDPGFDSRRVIIGTPVATLPGVIVSARAGWPGVSIL